MDLCRGAENGNLSQVLKALNNGADIKYRDEEFGRTPLSWAAETGSVRISKLLLKRGSDVNSKDNSGWTPLSWAAKKGHEGTVRLLLDQDDIDLSSKDNSGRTPLSWAAEKGNTRTLRLLLDQDSIDLNSKDNSGRTPLSWAAKKGNTRTLRLLLNQDSIDLNSKDNSGWTPLLWAAEKGNNWTVGLLLDQDDIDLNSKDNSGRTPLSWATEKGNEWIVGLLLGQDDIDLNSKDNNGRTPLSWVAEKGNAGTLRLLLDRDSIGMNSKDNNGRTPLSWAAEKRNNWTVRLLVDQDDIDLNSKDNSGRTPLSWAAEKGHVWIVSLLLGQDDIDLNSKDNSGRTTLSWAAEKGNKQIVRLLLDRDSIDLNSKDNNGRTPLSWAAENGNEWIVEVIFKRYNFDQDLKEANGLLLLALAAGKSHLPVIKLLVQNDNIIFHTLVQEKRESVVRQLIDARYVNVRDSLGKTPLHIAISCGHVEIAVVLISFSATDINLKDNDGVTPLRLAIQTKHLGLIQSLLDKSALTNDIMAHEWREAYNKQQSEIVVLSDKDNGERSVRFITQGRLSRETIECGTDICLFQISHHWAWPSGFISGPEVELAPYKLEISSQRLDGGQGDSIYIAVRFPTEFYLKQPKVPNWETCIIAWTVAPPSNISRYPYWKSIHYFSMMPFGWIPDNGVDFFKHLILHLKERWLKLCDQAKDHLAERRHYQLSSEGKNVELIRDLANDAKRWGDFRNSLQDQVREARSFAIEYSQHYNENQPLKDTQQLLDDLEAKVVNRINELDQTVRDLLQIEFAWVSMGEARISTRLGQNVMLLTYVSIFYLPLAFCTVLWAIPDITDRRTRNPFIITAVSVGLATYVVVFNLGSISGVFGGVYQTLRRFKREKTRDRPAQV